MENEIKKEVNQNPNTAKIDDNSILQTKLNNLENEFNKFKKSVVVSYLKKYQIKNEIDFSSFDFSSVENVEKSLINFCEKNKIKFSIPEKKSIFSDSKNEQTNNVNLMKGIYF